MKFNQTYEKVSDKFKIFEAKIDHKEYPKRLRKKSVDELKFIIKDAQEAMKANPDSEKSKNGYYADEVNYAAMELKRRKDGGKQEVDESNNMNQEGYKYYVVVDDNIESGWYNRDDAKEHVAENLPDEQNGKVVAKVSLSKLGLDPDNDSDWLGGEVLDKD